VLFHPRRTAFRYKPLVDRAARRAHGPPTGSVPENLYLPRRRCFTGRADEVERYYADFPALAADGPLSLGGCRSAATFRLRDRAPDSAEGRPVSLFLMMDLR